jgi:hypothetical protein
MEIKRVMKKVVALGTGATMVGATLLGALAAADLSQYPSPLFVKDGKFDGIIVVGDTAAGEDVVGAIDIATSLQYASKTVVSGTGTGVTSTVEGDAFKIAKSGDKLNLGEQLSGSGARGGPVTVVDKSDLKALTDGTMSNSKGTFTYNQYLDMPDSASVVYDIDSDQNDDPALYLKFNDDNKVYTYRLSFPTALRSDIDAQDDWKDLDNKKLNLLGKEYTIIGTDNSTGTLTLMGGAVLDTLSEGETKTYTINGVDYEVEVTIIASTDVLLKVNGEVTDKMQEATTFKLKDGTEIGVKTLLAQDFAGGSRLVEFYLGASKVEIVDNQFASGSAGTLTVGSESVSGVTADIVASGTASEVRISKIEVMWNATDAYFVPVGGKLSDRLPSGEKGKLFLENLDFKLAGVEFGVPEKIELKPAATNKYRVIVPTKTGGDLNFYAFYSDASAVCFLGKDAEHQIITAKNTQVGQNDMFIVSSNKFSHLIEVDAFDSANTKVKFKDVGTGDTFEVSTVNRRGTMYLDGFAYNFAANYNAKHKNITDATMGSDGAVLYTPAEAKVQILKNQTGTVCYLNVTEDASGHEDSTSAVYSIKTMIEDPGTGSNQPINIGTPTTADTYFSLQSWDSKNNFQSAYTSYGTYVEHDTNPDQDSVTFNYPTKEAEVDAYITSGVTKITQVAGGEGSTTTITPIQVGTAKLASEVKDIAAQNMIVVGGPCANAVARQLMGVELATCTQGFTEGKAMIKLYEQGTKVAMIVAGYSALDTHRASRALADFGTYASMLKGKEVQVSGTSLTDISVTAVG